MVNRYIDVLLEARVVVCNQVYKINISLMERKEGGLPVRVICDDNDVKIF